MAAPKGKKPSKKLNGEPASVETLQSKDIMLTEDELAVVSGGREKLKAQ